MKLDTKDLTMEDGKVVLVKPEEAKVDNAVLRHRGEDEQVLLGILGRIMVAPSHSCNCN